MITNEGIITFPAIFEPKESLNGDMKYSCGLLILKSDKEGVALIKKEIERAINIGKQKKWGGKLPNFNHQPLRDGDEELKNKTKEGAEYKGKFFLNATASIDFPPGVVDANAQPLIDRQAIYSGCIVRLDINAFPYTKKGNNGIGWGLRNVMFVRDGDRLDGRMDAVDAFADYTNEANQDDLA